MSDCGHPHHLQGMSMDVSSLSVPTDRPNHIMLFRKHVSRKAAGKARAVLEGVDLDTPTIDACFTDNSGVEEKIQSNGAKTKVTPTSNLPPGKCSFQPWGTQELYNSTLRS